MYCVSHTGIEDIFGTDFWYVNFVNRLEGNIFLNVKTVNVLLSGMKNVHGYSRIEISVLGPLWAVFQPPRVFFNPFSSDVRGCPS